jgi:transposase
MGKHRTPYPAEFRAHVVELVKAGRTPEEFARKFEPTAQTIINWVVQANRGRVREYGALHLKLAYLFTQSSQLLFV